MKCTICGESLSRKQSFCPRCGFNPKIKGLTEEEIRKVFEEIDRLPSDFNLFEWIKIRMNEKIMAQHTVLLQDRDRIIEGRMPECSGVLGDFQNVVQKKKKRKHLIRFSFRTVKVRRETLEPADPYYDDVLPEDWGEWSKSENSLGFRNQLLPILTAIAAIVTAMVLIVSVFLY